MEDSEIKLRCAICLKETPHIQRGTATETETQEIDIDGTTQEYPMEWHMLFVQCSVCDGVSVWVTGDWGDEPSQVYPAIKDLSGVPDPIKNSYREANKVKNISPIAFITLIRRALEYVCQDKGAVGKDLDQKLNDLSNRGIIPSTLARMTRAIRLFGNLSAHATDSKIGVADVHLIDDFFLAVIEYVYVAPEKLRKAAERFTQL